jgi:hypothetical protein
MSSANHTLNSLRYAERLKENSKGQGGQGIQAHPEDVQEELRLFVEKHGKALIEED